MDLLSPLPYSIPPSPATAEQPALIYEIAPGSSSSLSFAQLFRMADRVAAELRALNLPPQSVVGFTLESSPHFVVLLLALLRAELVAAPISPTTSVEHRERILAQSSARGCICPIDRESAFELEGSYEISILGQPFTFYRLHPPESAPCWVMDSPPAVIRFTSGTTGAPKGVVLSHRTINERTELAIQGFRITPLMRVLPVLPMAYHFVVSLLTYIRAGATIVLPASMDAPSILRLAESNQVDMIYGSPATFDALSRMAPSRKLPPGLRWISTTYSLSSRTRKSFEAQYQAMIEEYFGVFEVGIPLGPDKNESGSATCVMPGYEVEILDAAANAIITPETIGYLGVNGPGLFDGYLSPHFTPRVEVLNQGWFLTGDLAMRGPDGAVLVLGRASSAIIVDGQHLVPERLENTLREIDGIEDAQIIISPSGVVAAKIVTSSPRLTDSFIRERFLASHAAGKLQLLITRVHSLERTDSGKIVRSSVVDRK